LSVSVDSAPGGGDFQGMRVYRPMTPPSACNAGEGPPALLSIGSMSPPDYPSAWLPPCRARLRFARQDHCSSVTTCRFSTSKDRDSARTQTCQTRIVSVIAYVTPICSRAAALRRHPSENREKNAIRNGYPRRVWALRSFTQLLAATASRFAGRS
jgi:hypothetical protein